MPPGRKPEDLKATAVRLSPHALERIDELVGPGRRAKFIREAVDHALRLAVMLKETKAGNAE